MNSRSLDWEFLIVNSVLMRNQAGGAVEQGWLFIFTNLAVIISL